MLPGEEAQQWHPACGVLSCGDGCVENCWSSTQRCHLEEILFLQRLGGLIVKELSTQPPVTVLQRWFCCVRLFKYCVLMMLFTPEMAVELLLAQEARLACSQRVGTALG